jgi:single-strand DNA-binding protein
MNNITIAGILGRDSELKQLSTGELVLNLSIADSQGKEKSTIWWNASLFGKRAESLQKYLTKGTSVTISGNVSEREYKAQDGTPKKAISVRVQDIALQGAQKKEQTQQTSAPQNKSVSNSDFSDMDNDLPF